METSESIFSCLRRNKDEDNFDHRCKKMVVLREELRAQDVRLNPSLESHCKDDIHKWCAEELRQLSPGKESGGKVLLCLRKYYVKKKLTAQCEEHIRTIVKESAADYLQDAALAHACAAEIEKHCSSQAEASANDVRDRGRVEQCLKDHVAQKVITATSNKQCFAQISRILEESRFDIESDASLSRACNLELKDHCGDIPKGDGQRMRCLLDVYKNKKENIAENCVKMLDERISLWQLLVTVKPVESIGEYMAIASTSPAKNYLASIMLGVICIIFIVGLMCGRVTKRVRRELKNR